MSELLQIKDLCLVRGDRCLLDSFDLNLDSGQICIIQGKNGSGKSSLLRTVAGLLPPFDGQIRLQTSRLYFQDHHDSLFLQLTIKENILYWAKIKGWQIKKITDTLADLDSETILNLYPEALSQGQRRKLQMAFFIASDDDCYLLDEPYSFLDEETKFYLDKAILQKQQEQKLVMITMHERRDFPFQTCLVNLSGDAQSEKAA